MEIWVAFLLDKAYSNDQLDPETGLPKDDAVPQDTE